MPDTGSRRDPGASAEAGEILFADPGVVRALARSLHWAATPLGAVDDWPRSLRTAVDVCLGSRFPTVLLWRSELVCLHNEVHLPILGARHRALSRDGTPDVLALGYTTSPRMRPSLICVSLVLAAPACLGAQGNRDRSRALSTAGVAGTYRSTRGSTACIFEVAPVAPDSVRLQLYCNRGAPSYSMGSLDERLPFLAGSAVFTTSEFSGRCRLTFRFTTGRATVAQEDSLGGCGFGYGVFVGGTYRRVSRRAPPFDLSPEG